MTFSRNVFKAIFISVGVALGTCALGQYGIAVAVKSPVKVGDPLVDKKTGKTFTVEEGQKITDPQTGALIGIVTSNGNTILVEPNRTLEIGGHTFVVPQRTTTTISVYPEAAFSVAGQLIGSGQAASGGTYTSWGTILALDVRSPFSKPSGAWEVGGFVFLPNTSDVNNLFQVDVRHFWEPWLGVQVGYLNSTNGGNASSASAYLVGRVDSNDIKNCSTPFALELGIGTFADYAPLVTNGPNNSGYSVQTDYTYNYSSFVQATLGLRGNLSLVGSEWYIRNRNTDIQRISLGLSLKF